MGDAALTPESSDYTLPASQNKGDIILSSKNLCKSFMTGKFEQVVLKGMNLDIYEGDFTIIMGSSGAGKSTLLYALSGMDKPTSGKIYFGEHEISGYSSDKLAVFRRKNCGFVFQQIFLIDNMSVIDNILACGMLVFKDKRALLEKAKRLLKQVELEEMLWRKFPSQLSGGEGQRAAVVRAVINDPTIVFADEPTGSLNSSYGQAVLDVLTDMNERGQSIIMVTHDMNSARRGNRIIYLKDGVIRGECQLGKYISSDGTRYERLNAFLGTMGW
jgi:putative ABC transport system ATP-binding protein